MATEFGLNHPLAVKRWSTALAVEAEVQQYFRKFMGTDKKSPVMVIRDLEKQAGDKVVIGLRMKLAKDGIEGDNIIEGTTAEEDLNFYSDHLFISQRRKSTKSKGKMSEQRVPYDMRAHGRDALASWFAEDIDQQIFLYLCGMAPNNSTYFPANYEFLTLNPGYHVSNSWTGRANNMVGYATGSDGTKAAVGSTSSPGFDAAHHIWGGDATSTTDVDATDVFSIATIEKALAKLETLDPMIQPIRVDGEDKFVVLMHNFQAFSLRNATSTNDWVDIRKNTDGKDSILYQNALGEYAGMVLHKHRYCVRFKASNVVAGRALILGAQAALLAFGRSGSYGRYSWNEETDDRGNALVITAGSIFGVERCSFNAKVFGCIGVTTACVDPSA